MLYKDGQRISDALAPIDVRKKTELRRHEELIMGALTELSHELDIERPVLVKKHLNDIFTYGRVVFRPQDFLESVGFDRFIIEVIADE